MNLFQTWTLFNYPNRKMGVISYDLQKILPRVKSFEEIRTPLIAINNRRRIVQKELLSLSLSANICGNPCLRCCNSLSDYNHYKSVDYVMRLFSENPISDYYQAPKPVGFIEFILKRVIAKMRSNKSQAFGSTTKLSETDPEWWVDTEAINHPGTECPNLKEDGCEYPPEDRPLVCVVHTCPLLRSSIKEDELYKIGVLTKELLSLAQKTKRLVKTIA